MFVKLLYLNKYNKKIIQQIQLPSTKSDNYFTTYHFIVLLIILNQNYSSLTATMKKTPFWCKGEDLNHKLIFYSDKHVRYGSINFVSIFVVFLLAL